MNAPPVTIVLRRMREEDLADVRGIERLSFSNPWTENTFRGEIQNTSISFPLVAVHGPEKRIVGYIVYWQVGEDVQINNVAVHPDFRGRGVGEAMIRHALGKVARAGATFVTLEVRMSNLRAIRLYKKLGFRILGARRNYYTNPPEDAYVMGFSIEPEEASS